MLKWGLIHLNGHRYHKVTHNLMEITKNGLSIKWTSRFQNVRYVPPVICWTSALSNKCWMFQTCNNTVHIVVERQVLNLRIYCQIHPESYLSSWNTAQMTQWKRNYSLPITDDRPVRTLPDDVNFWQATCIQFTKWIWRWVLATVAHNQ